MRKFAIGLFVLSMVAVGAFANPFTGKWNVIVAFQDQQLVFDFQNDGTYTVTGGADGDQAPTSYTVDEDNQTINLGELEGTQFVAEYDFSDDNTFEIYFPSTMEDALATQLADSMAISDSANHLTTDLRDAMVSAVRDAIYNSIFMEGTRVTQ